MSPQSSLDPHDAGGAAGRNDGSGPSRPPQTPGRRTRRERIPARGGGGGSERGAGAGTGTGLVFPLTLLRPRGGRDRGGGSPEEGGRDRHRHRHRPAGGVLERVHAPSFGRSRPPDGRRGHHRADPSAPRTPQVDGYRISKISQARERIKRSFDKSELLDGDECVFPRFEIDELALGKVLGRGGFGTVLEIQSMGMAHQEPEPEPEPEGERPERRGEAIGPTGGVSEKSSVRVAFSEKSSVVSIDEFEHQKELKKKKHGFHFPRRRGHHHPRSHSLRGDRHRQLGLQLTRSQDSMEGLSASATFDGLRRGAKSERDLGRGTQSFDPLDGCGALTPKEGIASVGAPHSDPKGGKHKRPRSKTLSWTHAKAAAHDVSHFFHRSPKHNHHPQVARHDEIEEAPSLSEEGKDPEREEGKAAEDAEKKDPPVVDKKSPGGKGEKGGRHARHVGCDESAAPSSAGGEKAEPPARTPGGTRRPRNFSFVAWRDSEAGEEGNDAIPPEELERYDINGTVSKSFSAESDEKGGDDKQAGGEGGGGGDGGEGPNAEDPAYSSKGEGKKKLTVQRQGARGRRVIVKSIPKEGGVPEPEPAEDISPGSKHGTPHGAQGEEHEVADLVTATINNAAYYGGYRAKEIVTATINNAAYHGGIRQDKAYITERCSTPQGQAQYAVKLISPHIVEGDFKKFLQAAMDMATETYFLSVLDHPHILKLRAVGQGDMFSPDYFLVLDRLYGTLAERIEGTWSAQLDHLENDILVWGRARKLRALWEERVGVMRDLAGALRHLHDLRIVYRDVKPENVGFDGRGAVKLFDFGLAKECRDDDECTGGTYKLTPNTGSIRYMAPENGNKWPYNFLADSYSFGILLWEATSLERPFASYTPREMRDMVMKWGERPKVRADWSERVVDLMKRSWDSNFRKRPPMKVIEETLEKEIEDSPI